MRVIVRKYICVSEDLDVPNPFDVVGNRLVDIEKGNALFTKEVYENVNKFGTTYQDKFEMYIDGKWESLDMSEIFSIKIVPSEKL